MGLRLIMTAGLAAAGVVSLGADQKPMIAAPDAPRPALGADTAAADKPLVDSEALQATISIEALLARAKDLFQIAHLSHDEYNHPTRVIGSAGHVGTLNYIRETLAALRDYYTVSTQPFPAVTGAVFESRLVVDLVPVDSATAMSLTPPTCHRQPVDGDLVLIAGERRLGAERARAAPD